MNRDVINLNRERQRRSPESIESIVDICARQIFDDLPKDLPEPKGLASGGSMNDILNEAKEVDDEPINP